MDNGVHSPRFSRGNNRSFTQEDPIGLAGSLNLYGFANGDPINFSDPFGLSPDTVDVYGEDAKRRVKVARQADPAFAVMYDSMAAAPQHFSLISSDALTGKAAGQWATITGWSFGPGAPQELGFALSISPELAPFVGEKTVGAAVYGVHSRNPMGSMKHELAHLYGIIWTGRVFLHGDHETQAERAIFKRFPIP